MKASQVLIEQSNDFELEIAHYVVLDLLNRRFFRKLTQLFFQIGYFTPRLEYLIIL